jgi:hypothetical protein
VYLSGLNISITKAFKLFSLSTKYYVDHIQKDELAGYFECTGRIRNVYKHFGQELWK